MTWARTVATGFGATNYRLKIAGAKYEFVTDYGMKRAATADLAGRAVGLMRKGLVADQRVDLRKGLPSDSGMTVTIADPDGYAAEVFAHLPDKRTYLTADAAANATSLTVASIAGWAKDDPIYIGGERLKCTATPSSFTIPTAVASGRGLLGTYAQAHYATDGQYLSSAPVTNRPLTVEGRRCWLYAYGEGDSPTGDGTLAFAGVCSTDAKRGSDGSTFTLQIESRARLLAQTLGSRFGKEVRPRGVYYSDGAALRLRISCLPGVSRYDSPSDAFDTPLVFTGFYETQQDFCDALNTAIAAKIAAELTLTSTRVEAAPTEDGGWTFTVTPPVSGTARYVNVDIYSPTDMDRGSTRLSLVSITDGSVVDAVGSDTQYRVDWGNAEPAGHRSVPRGFAGWAAREWYTGLPADTGFPSNRIYYDGPGLLGSNAPTAAWIEWPENGEAQAYAGETPVTATVASQYLDSVHVRAPSRAYYGTALPKIRLVDTTAVGNLSDFVQQLVTNAPAGRNRGSCPDLHADDFVTTSWAVDWDAVVDPIANSTRLMASRRYWLGEAMRLDKYLTGELAALGMYLVTDASGRMVPRVYSAPVATDPNAVTVSASMIDLSRGLPSWEKQGLGDAHTIVLHSGRTIASDKPDRVMTTIDAEAHAKNPAAQIVDVTLYSGAADGLVDMMTGDEARTAFGPMLGILGHEYAIVELETFINCHAIQLGDTIVMTTAHLPNWSDGTRGVTNLAGLVIGRRAEYDGLKMRFRVYVTGTQVCGYCPSVGVMSQSGSNPTWTLTVAFTDPLGLVSWAVTGETLSDHFATGDVCNLVRWNSTTSTQTAATIVSVNDATMEIVVTATWTPGTSKWTLDYGNAGAALSTAQKLYAYWAGSDRAIGFASGDVAAKAFGA